MGPALRHACQARYFRARGGAVDRILSDVRPKCAAPYKKTGGCAPRRIPIASNHPFSLRPLPRQQQPPPPPPPPPRKLPPRIDRRPPPRGASHPPPRGHSQITP